MLFTHDNGCFKCNCLPYRFPNKNITDKSAELRALLFYIYKSGSPSSFQYAKTYTSNKKQYDGGLKIAKNTFAKIYKNKNERKYIELNIFFTLSGNGVKNNTCDGIISSKNKTYEAYAKGYNNVIKVFKKLGYSNVKGYVLSHAPLNTKQMINEFPESSKKNKIVVVNSAVIY